MRYLRLIVPIIIGAVLITITACDKDEENDKNKQKEDQSNFNRKSMLQNIGSNVIIPDYKTFKEKAKALNESAGSFTSNPSQTSLEKLRKDFISAYTAWQKVTPYGFGPANEMTLRNNLNTFPVDTQGIEKRISNDNKEWGPYDNDLKGFPALDYLLYQHNAEKTIAAFKSDASPENRKSYLKAITKEISQMADDVHSKWMAEGGNYIEQFINSDGNDKGSSLALLVNELNFDYEIIKNPKLGIPLGKKSLGETKPKNVEAYYSGESLDLIITNLNAIEDLFLGRYGSKNGVGLDDHLDDVGATRDGQQLSQAIVNQFSNARSKLKNLNGPLSDAIKENKSQVDKAYEEVQKQVVLIKTDMPSALGVRITYQDNDGD